MEDDAAHQLNVKWAHVHCALGNFAYNGKGFDQEVIQRLARSQSAREMTGHGPQLIICPLFHLGFQLVYGVNQGLEFPYFAIVAPANDSAQ